MDLSLDQYILNPMGKKNSVLNAATREALKRLYQMKFDNIMVRENGKVNYHLFYSKNSETYWAYFEIPSEAVPKFYYDVVFKFTATESIGGNNDLFKYNTKFYSNDPSFVYTYAYVFKKNDLFIKELSSRMSKQALTKEATEKNPHEDINYVKTIMFAYFIMKNRGLNKLYKFKAEAQPLDPDFLLSHITPADEKIEERQELGSHMTHRKKINLTQGQVKAIEKATGNKNLNLSRVNIVRDTKTVKVIKANNKITKTVKRK